MFAKIIPLQKLPRKFFYFDYSIPKNLKNKIKIGHIVAISFRGKKIFGAVCEFSNPDLEIKNILPILDISNIILPPNYIQTIITASKKYLVSPGTFLSSAIPSLKKPKELSRKQIVSKNFSLFQEDAKDASLALQKFKKSECENFFLYSKGIKYCAAFFIKIAEKVLSSDGQALYLAPTIELASYFSQLFTKYFPKKLILWETRSSKSTKMSDWQKIASGEPLIVISPRSGSLLPFKKLALVFIYESSSADYKQYDMNPRYDAREIIKTIDSARKIYCDAFYDIAIFEKIKARELETLNSPLPLKINIVDARKKSDFSTRMLSHPLYNSLLASLEKKEKSILLLNRGLRDKILRCQECNFIFECNKCSSPLAVDKNELLCYYCDIKSAVQMVCQNCKSPRLKATFEGLSSLSAKLKKEFPRARVATLNKEEETKKNYDILLATDYFWNSEYLNLQEHPIGTLACLDFDSYMIKNEYNQKEVAFLFLKKLLCAGHSLKARDIIAQTTNPESAIFQNVEDFFRTEEKNRVEAEYPPFKTLIKIICKEENEKTLQVETEKLYNKLVAKKFNCLPAFSPEKTKRGKYFINHIIMKESKMKDLSLLYSIIPNNYQIDINPISIY